MDRRSYAAAVPLLAELLAECSEHGLELYRHYVLAYSARVALEQGRWQEATELAEAVLAVRRASTTPTIIALVVVGLLRARRGDPDPWSLLDEAHELAAVSGELLRIGPTAVARAETAWLLGSPDAVVPLTDAAFQLAIERRAPWLAGELAVWRLRAGAREKAPPSTAEPCASELAGDRERAAELWRGLGCDYNAALVLANGDDGELLRSMELERLGATPAAGVVRRRLRARGVRGLPRGPRAATRRNPRGLTTRELDVLRLLADGLRNTVIAERLFLSRRTVDHHVSSVLRKLDAHSRGESSRDGPPRVPRRGIARRLRRNNVLAVLVGLSPKPQLRSRDSVCEAFARTAQLGLERLPQRPQRSSLLDSWSNHIAKSVNWVPEMRSSATSTIVAVVISLSKKILEQATTRPRSRPNQVISAPRT